MRARENLILFTYLMNHLAAQKRFELKGDRDEICMFLS